MKPKIHFKKKKKQDKLGVKWEWENEKYKSGYHIRIDSDSAGFDCVQKAFVIPMLHFSRKLWC